VVRSVIKGDKLISERDYVDHAIAEYFQEVDGGESYQADSDKNSMKLRNISNFLAY
jgi:hypothetical protein